MTSVASLDITLLSEWQLKASSPFSKETAHQVMPDKCSKCLCRTATLCEHVSIGRSRGLGNQSRTTGYTVLYSLHISTKAFFLSPPQGQLGPMHQRSTWVELMSELSNSTWRLCAASRIAPLPYERQRQSCSKSTFLQRSSFQSQSSAGMASHRYELETDTDHFQESSVKLSSEWMGFEKMC